MKIKEVRLPYHRLKHKYKEHDRLDNIIVGQGELCFVEQYNGWITLDGHIITDRDVAIEYATRLDKYHTKQRIRFNRYKNGDRY